MFKLVLVSCLLALALAYPHHNAGHTQHDEEKPAVSAESAEAEKPQAEEVKSDDKNKPVDGAEPAKEAEKVAESPKEEAKPDSDAAKKEEGSAPLAEEQHADTKPDKS